MDGKQVGAIAEGIACCLWLWPWQVALVGSGGAGALQVNKVLGNDIYGIRTPS